MLFVYETLLALFNIKYMEMADQIIIDKLTVFRHDKIQLNTCRIKETWLKDHRLYDYLIKCNYTYNSIIVNCNLETDNIKLYETLNFKLESDKIKFTLNYYNYKRSEFRFNKSMLKEFLNCNKDDIREDYLKCYSPYLIYKKRD